MNACGLVNWHMTLALQTLRDNRKITLRKTILQTEAFLSKTMDQDWLQERIRAAKAMEEAQAEYKEYKETLKQFEAENGILPDNATWKILQARVESCRRTYDKLVESYKESLKKMPVADMDALEKVLEKSNEPFTAE